MDSRVASEEIVEDSPFALDVALVGVHNVRLDDLRSSDHLRAGRLLLLEPLEDIHGNSPFECHLGKRYKHQCAVITVAQKWR